MFGRRDAERVARLRNRREQAASPPRRVLEGHHHRAAPSGAERQALDHADQHEQQRRRHPTCW
jgi:hypothetical protein